MKRAGYLAIVALLVSATAWAQAAKKHPAEPRPSSKVAEKLDVLTPPVNPEALARALHPADNPGSSRQANPASASVPAVMELRAVPASTNAHNLTFKSGSSKKLKDFHGAVDGSLGTAGWRSVGAAAGATSKNGKTSIFVRAGHATVQKPR